MSPATYNPARHDCGDRVVYPTTAPQDGDDQLVGHHLRATVIPQAIAGTGVKVYVGGETRR